MARQREYRVTRVSKGRTTIVRTCADGKTETRERTENDVHASAAGRTSPKHVGNSEVTTCTVALTPQK